MSAGPTPVVRVDALETFVELLTRVDRNDSSDAFYSSLCEAVCRLTSMDRAVIFRYDDLRRRVRAAGAYGLDLAPFQGAHVTAESAPIARQALVEDRVIEMDAEMVAREVPERFRSLLDDTVLVCVPLSAGGRWSGVILADRRPRRPLSDEERDLLWTLGKTAALAEAARHATFQQARARQLQERIDLAREVHEGVIQRLFGVLVVVSRNAGKHASPTRVEVKLERQDGAWVMEVCNDGVRGRTRTISGMGLRLAALEALQVGGVVEFGEREPGVWRGEGGGG